MQKQFESYYPANFQDRVFETLSIANNQERRESKRVLLEEVRTWLDTDPIRGKAALEQSAREIIEDLQKTMWFPWVLVFVLVWQGGAARDPMVAAVTVLILFVIVRVLDMIYPKQEKFYQY